MFLFPPQLPYIQLYYSYTYVSLWELINTKVHFIASHFIWPDSELKNKKQNSAVLLLQTVPTHKSN